MIYQIEISSATRYDFTQVFQWFDKFIGLHIQAPLLKEFLCDNSATFYFTQGPCETVPPPGFEAYFGGKPYYRFMTYEGGEGGEGVDILERIRDFPEGITAEDTLRELMVDGLGDARQSVRRALDYLYRIMEEEGPFEGIIGYSEGATVAATLLLDEQQRLEKEGRTPMLKCAIFFAGWPPLTPEADAMVLADESDLVLDVHTCHVGEYL